MHIVNVFASCAMQSIVYAYASVRMHTDVACNTLNFAVTLMLWLGSNCTEQVDWTAIVPPLCCQVNKSCLYQLRPSPQHFCGVYLVHNPCRKAFL